MTRTTRAVILGALTLFATGWIVGQVGKEASSGDTAEELRDAVEGLNLDFEEADEPVGWHTGGQGYSVVIDTSEKQTGEHSLQITFEETGNFGVASNIFPVDVARGKRLRLTGYLKTEKITTGWAGLWLRIDGPEGLLGFDNMQRRGVIGTTGWTLYEVVLDVPNEAVNIVFGALLTGDGTVWADALSFELTETAGPPPTITIEGIVRDPEGRPVAGAQVALVGPASNSADGRGQTGDYGRFSIDVSAGEYAVTATAPGLTAAFKKTASFAANRDHNETDLSLGGDGFTISGIVTDESNCAVPGVPLVMIRSSTDTGDIFYTETDDAGRYSVKLIPADSYWLQTESEDFIATPETAVGGEDQTINLSIVRRGPAPDGVVASITAHAVPLKTAEAGSGLDDMEPLREIVGDARVVGLGEATHGSREFFQLKHRMLEFLVQKMGFTIFAIEANWPESLAINDYVVNGKGDPIEALAGIYFWTWNTEEVLELIEWMRRYNADPAHETKIKFYGFDMQTPTVAAREAVAYLDRVDPEYAARLDEAIDPLKDERAMHTYQKLSKEDRGAIESSIEHALERMDAKKASYIEESNECAWVMGRQQIVILQQAVRMYSDKGGRGYGARDEAMAANIEWILDTEPPGTRVVVWAHNGHVSRDGESGMAPMGSHLAASLGDDYLVVGFVFNQGAFQAIDWSQGQGRPGALNKHSVGPAPDENIGAAFARTGIPLFVLDLRVFAEDEATGRWLRAPHPMRQIGAVFSNESAMSHPVVLTQHYDAMIFVDETTRARPVRREEKEPEDPKTEF